ncbi:chitooligosaccharidolytic beta-N-acetylglucosaminidase-like [Macrobrachium nipponense]|uniref:chitooligosaccharidolytic beta-N-acetylglucosaminidase-like n=1 Tax=Macrobrachium nipponense TaxID=159736 RepID=UPI0030C8CBD8
MRVLAAAAALIVAAVSAQDFYRLSSPYSFSCIDNFCVRQLRTEVSSYHSQAECQLTCGHYGSLLPHPTGNVELSKEGVHFNPEHFQVTKMAVPDQKVSKMLEEAVRYTKRNLHFLHPDYQSHFKTPYTEKEKVQYVRENPRQFTRKATKFNQETPQEQTQEHEIDQTELYESWERFSPFLGEKYSPRINRHQVNMEITVNNPVQKLRLDTDESYQLDVKTTNDETLVVIQAPTFFGARHALETFSQMIAFDDSNNALMIIKDATVTDSPKFKYRGFMLDTSRNFYPKEDLMRLIDTMAQNKMNYFQWHITDAASFPMYSEHRPEMAYYGAYSSRKVYYPKDIKKIVEYARLRGINVVPEISGPAQNNAGWQWGEKNGKGRLVLCAGEKPWFDHVKEPVDGHLNPVNPEVYNVLGEIYKDAVEYFDPEMVHFGGDGVSFKCWQNSNDIKEYLAANALESNSEQMFKLWNIYQNNVYNKLTEAAGPERKITPIIHSSSFVRNYINKDNYIVQVNEASSDPVAAQYVKDGYKVIFANLDQWRVDCIDSSWYGEKSEKCPLEAPTWRNFYENSPLDNLQSIPNIRDGQTPESLAYKNNVLGGIVLLYSSETDANGIDSKSWPRVSAMAERLWSDPAKSPQGFDTKLKRLNVHRQRMVARGTKASPLQPEICSLDETVCYSKEEYAARSANIPQTP